MAVTDAAAPSVLVDRRGPTGPAPAPGCGSLEIVAAGRPDRARSSSPASSCRWCAPIPKPTGGDVLESLLPAFSPGHLLGTDPNGNDILSRILYGGRSSLIVALAVNLLGLDRRRQLGALAGYARRRRRQRSSCGCSTCSSRSRRWCSPWRSRRASGPSQRNTILALAFFSIPAFARISRAATLRLREQPFMVAAKLSGTPTWRILCAAPRPEHRPRS